MKKNVTRSLAPLQFHQNLSIFQENQNLKNLSQARPSSLSDHLIVRKERVIMPRNASIQQIDSFQLDELVETDDVEFAVNTKDAFVQKMKLPKNQLTEIETRLIKIEQAAKKNKQQVYQLHYLNIQLADRLSVIKMNE